MRNARHQAAHRSWRHALLAGAAAVALGMGAPAVAQQQGGQQQAQGQANQAPSKQPGSAQPAVVGQLRTAEQSLRQAHGQISGDQQPNFAQARTAVSAGQEVLGRVPQQVQGQVAYQNARRQLDEANRALQGQQPDEQQVATQLREAADAMGALAGRVASAGASGANAGGASSGAGARVNVQQPAPQVTVQQQQPQITVTQPSPQVTVQQPPPQVNIQQPEPRVTVQQAQPQVRVQQAEPQVDVEQPGQPQVTVRQQGEPRVTVQGKNGQDQRSTGSSADQNTGATSATPAPAQSGGSQSQSAAVSPAAGVPLTSVQGLVGKNVAGANARDAGEVRNLLIDGSGQVRAAVVEWGGFLGLGERQAVVPIDRIQLGQNPNERARLNMSRQELEALPRYDRDRMAEYASEHGWGDNVRLFR